MERTHIGTCEILLFHHKGGQTLGQVPGEVRESPNLEMLKTLLIKVLNQGPFLAGPSLSQALD